LKSTCFQKSYGRRSPLCAIIESSSPFIIYNSSFLLAPEGYTEIIQLKHQFPKSEFSSHSLSFSISLEKGKQTDAPDIDIIDPLNGKIDMKFFTKTTGKYLGIWELVQENISSLLFPSLFMFRELDHWVSSILPSLNPQKFVLSNVVVLILLFIILVNSHQMSDFNLLLLMIKWNRISLIFLLNPQLL
jgi:hypothetical protein